MDVNTDNLSEIREVVKVDNELRVKFYFKRAPLPLPNWLISVIFTNRCTINCYSDLSCKSFIERTTFALSISSEKNKEWLFKLRQSSER